MSFSLFKNALVSLITALQGLFVAQVPVTPTPVVQVTQEEVASGVAPSPTPPLSPTTPKPTPDLVSIVQELENLKQEIINAPEPTPQVIVIQVTPVPTSVVMPVATPTPTPVPSTPTPTPTPTPVPFAFKEMTYYKVKKSSVLWDAPKTMYGINLPVTRKANPEESASSAIVICNGVEMFAKRSVTWNFYISEFEASENQSCVAKLLLNGELLDEKSVEINIE